VLRMGSSDSSDRTIGLSLGRSGACPFFRSAQFTADRCEPRAVDGLAEGEARSIQQMGEDASGTMQKAVRWAGSAEGR
jgi:hypothetical protein